MNILRDRKDKSSKYLAGGVRVAIVVGLLALAVVSYYFFSKKEGATDQYQGRPLLPAGFALSADSKEVVGNLGGLPVKFPRNFVDGVEYDGDPGFGEKRELPAANRTAEMGLRSLGFFVRSPEFLVMDREQANEDRKKYSRYTTPWISVSIIAGSYFGDGKFLERSVERMNDDPGFQYEKLPGKKFDLDAYTPVSVDPSKRFKDPKTGSYGKDMRDQDVFVFLDKKTGKVETYIECSNIQHDGALCQQYFYLRLPLRVKVSALYRRGQLENWRLIQSSIRRVILDFKNN
ncbi:hypothetical protein [Variovorax rhizosphaerae]|uniref:Uncharacterized protein n=1 Tax=Variovorax rhizosphaerae TaxID=1836200 RepID=A0ABU8WT39_9BURK